MREFFALTGDYLSNVVAAGLLHLDQLHTFVARDPTGRAGMNVIAQAVAARGEGG